MDKRIPFVSHRSSSFGLTALKIMTNIYAQLLATISQTGPPLMMQSAL